MINLLRRCTAIACVVAVVGLVFGLAGPALAQMGDVSIGGVWVCRLTRGIGQMSLDDRMVEIERRIANVLHNPKYRGVGVGVSVRPTGPNAEIVVGDTSIMVVTVEDVAGTNVRPVEAARQWAARLVKGMNQALPDGNFRAL
jgi:hypothetical protein